MLGLDLDFFLNKIVYVIGFFAFLMTMFSLAKHYGIFIPVYRWIVTHVKSKRVAVALVSLICGVLPIEGRVVASASWLNTLAPEDKEKRKVFGIVDYLSTHHYYFWSPLEQTVLLPIAALSISYWAFLGMIWPLAVTAIGFAIYYIFFVLKEDDIDISVDKLVEKKAEKEKLTIFNILKWDTLLYASLIIIIGGLVGQNAKEWSAVVKSTDASIFLACGLALVFSFMLGSSGKYAGLVVILTAIYGIAFLPIFFAVCYLGYLVSPVHKCTLIAINYFGTNPVKFYTVVGAMGLMVLLVSLVWTLVPMLF